MHRTRLLSRCNRAFSKALVALWPEERKAWGLAFTRELPAIESPERQFLWLLGGVPVLLRERVRSFLASLARPMGVGATERIEELPGGRRPRTPRVVVALLLALFAWVLGQPATRTAFRLVSGFYSGSGWDSARWPETRRIETLARGSRDPELQAFASLLLSDPEERLALSDAAIRSDPSLTWIDYANSVLPSNEPGGRRLLSSERINRLSAADPGNAALYLLRAEAAASPYEPDEGGPAAWKGRASGDPNWLAAMERAFDAPRYDPYDRRRLELARKVITRYSVNDPRLLAVLLGQRPVDQYPAIRAYAKVLLARSSDLERSGRIAPAAAECAKVLAFSKRLRAGGFFNLETWVANDVESLAYTRLAALEQTAGRSREAAEAARLLEENRSERARLSKGHGTPDARRRALLFGWSAVEWAALAMQASVLAIWILLPASLLSVLGLAIAPRSRLRPALAAASDLCPSFLLLASSVLFMSYLPYDEGYWQALRAPFSPASYPEFANAAYAPFRLPPEVPQNGLFLFWSAVTAVLALLALRLVVRLLPGRRRS